METVVSEDVFIAFDAAKKCGVCYGPAFKPPVVTTWDLPGDLGERGCFLMKNTRLTFERIKPAKCFIEAPMEAHVATMAGTAPTTTISLNGYVFVLMMVCHQFDVPWELYPRQTILKHFTGQGRYAKKDDGKRACVVRCKQLGYEVRNYDEADAAALWDYGCAVNNPRAYALAGVQRAAMRR